MKINKEIYETLAPYEDKFNAAIKHGYGRISIGESVKVMEVYNMLYEDKLTRPRLSCSTCVLKMLKRIGKDYFKYKEWYEKRYGSQQDLNNSPSKPQEQDK